MYCKKCGAKMPNDKDYCVRCGGNNQINIPNRVEEESHSRNLPPVLPMNFHKFYLVLLAISILLSLYSILTEGFTIWDIVGLGYNLILLITLSKLQKIGYILFMISNAFSIMMILSIYGMFILSLFGIVIFSRINPFAIRAAFASSISIDFLELAKFTGIVVALVAMLVAIGIYYRKRKDMFT